LTKVRRRHPLFTLFLQQCAVLALATTSAPASTFPRRKRREHKYAEAEEELISFYDYYQEYATSSLFSRFTLADTFNLYVLVCPGANVTGPMASRSATWSNRSSR
jgi:hypothetical protein